MAVLKVLLVLLLFQLMLGKDWLYVKLPPAPFLKKTCLRQADKNSHYPREIKALICGEPLSTSKSKHLLMNLGLIHMFVVSGAHLSFYKKIIGLALPHSLLPWLQIPFLILYTLICQFSAPLLRATTEEILLTVNKKLKLNWLREQTLLVAGLTCLLLRPSLLHGLSLPLSWVAALCLCQKSHFVKIFTLFIALYPLLIIFYLPNPFSLISGFFLTGIISLFLLPLNLISFCLPFFNPCLKFFFDLFYIFLETIHHDFPDYVQPSPIRLHFLWIWLYVLAPNILIILFKKRKANL